MANLKETEFMIQSKIMHINSHIFVFKTKRSTNWVINWRESDIEYSVSLAFDILGHGSHQSESTVTP